MATMELHKRLAILDQRKKHAQRAMTEVDRKHENLDAFFSGLSRQYTPKDDAGEKLPDEDKVLRTTVWAEIRTMMPRLADAWDIVATVDLGNQQAAAPVVLADGTQLTPPLPSPFLLYFLKQLADLRTLVSRLPVLDEGEIWTKNENSESYRAKPVETLKTQKKLVGVVLHPGTDKFAPQTTTTEETTTVGTWTSIKQSGAIPVSERTAMVYRIDRLIEAVQAAKEEANRVKCDDVEIAKPLLDFVFYDKTPAATPAQ